MERYLFQENYRIKEIILKTNNMTAVEWLLTQIENKNGKEFSSYYTEFIEQAKAMEKEQKESYYKLGYVHGVGDSRLTNMIIDKNK